MATPAAGGMSQIAQVAQQQLQKPDSAPKAGASKFDQAMAQKAEAKTVQQADQVQAAAQAQAVQKTGHVDQVQRAGKADEAQKARAVRENDPVSQKPEAQKPGMGIERLLTDMEGRNAAMEKFIHQAINGQLKLDQQQLLGLQAKVNQYSLELDLTGKVVEKATTGLKDTLRTQV